ncbi:putative ribonuclease H-like domain-containing protein [Tanacetum coccineum]
MEFESAQSGTTAKLPILKLGEYESWVIRIRQYFQIQDYALWDFIENGNSWVSVPQTAQENGTSVTKMFVPVTAKEKTNKKNDVKARSLLLRDLPNDLHSQQYEKFSASSAESLDSIFNRLQKIVSRLAILGVVIAQEDLNSKFLSCLPPEWNTHVVVWMNKPKIKTMSIDDLYNNFKIVEQKVKKSVGASDGAQNLAFMTAPSTSSTNEINTASPQNPNDSNLLHQDLEQIHEDDLEAMDLKWQLSLLSMRAKRYYQRTGNKIFINANDTAGYDKSKVECFNCHKMGYFARECKAPRSKEGQFRNQNNTRKQGNNEDTSSKAMLAIDGVGFDWSDMAEEQLLGSQITEKSKKGLGYSAVPPPHPLIYNRPKKLDLSYSGLDEFKEPEFKGYGSEDSKNESNVVCDKKSDDSKENSDNSLNDTGFIDSGCLRHMTRNIAYLSDFKEFDGGYVTFRGGAHGGRISVQVADTLRVVDLADSPVSTSTDQDAPSTSIPSTQEQDQSPIISQGFEELPKTPHFYDDPLHEHSTSQGSSSNILLAQSPPESNFRPTLCGVISMPFSLQLNRRLIKKQCSNPPGLMQYKKKYMNSRDYNRPDIVFAVYMCARYQTKPTEKHLHAMQTTPGVKILDKAHLEVHNSWEINLLAGHPKSKRALLSPVQRQNILLYLGVVLKSYG